jgi:hypothetical protein
MQGMPQQDSSGFVHSSATQNLVRSECQYCKAIFISSEPIVLDLEREHRKECRKTTALVSG